MKRKNSGVSLVEIIVVISIIAVVGMVIGLVIGPRAKEAGLRATCTSNLRQLAFAWNLYRIDNDDAPPLTLAQIGPRIWYCPLDDIPYVYNGSALLLTPEGVWKYSETFNPSTHPIIKCIQHHRHTGETELNPMTNAFGKSVMRKTPIFNEGDVWNVLSVTMDGSVRYRPFTDELTTAGSDSLTPPEPTLEATSQ